MSRLSAASQRCYDDVLSYLTVSGGGNWSAVAARHPEVQPRQFWRIVKRAKSEPPVRGREIRKGLAAVTEISKLNSAELLAEVPPEVIRKPDEPINAIGVLKRALQGCDRIEQCACRIDANGQQTIRNPQLYARSIELRLKLISAMTELADRARDLSRVAEFWDAIVDEIGKVDLELRDNVIRRLRLVDAERGWGVGR